MRKYFLFTEILMALSIFALFVSMALGIFKTVTALSTKIENDDREFLELSQTYYRLWKIFSKAEHKPITADDGLFVICSENLIDGKKDIVKIFVKNEVLSLSFWDADVLKNEEDSPAKSIEELFHGVSKSKFTISKICSGSIVRLSLKANNKKYNFNFIAKVPHVKIKKL